ncbi:MAG: hypothetical protein IT368_14895 [Candidatus Hydrogenedentes bacterium]|nr:hypothetical protein [Candidatus Hydrogenedentota bacterium]
MRTLIIASLVVAAGLAGAEDRCRLEEAMFVFPSGGEVLTELSPVQDKLFEQFKEAIATLESEWGEVDLQAGTLNASLQQFVLSKLPHQVGDGWEVYVFEGATVKKATLKAVRLAPGTSGWRSFAGILAGIRVPEGAEEGKPFGFALPCGMPVGLGGLEIGQAPDRAARALDTVVSRTQRTGLELVEHLLVTVPAEKQSFVIGVARDEKGARWMFLAQATNEQPSFVPFSGDDTNDGLLLIDPSPAEGETTMQSRYHVLPDMNGDAMPEIVVLSHATRLYGIKPQRGGAVTVELGKAF